MYLTKELTGAGYGYRRITIAINDGGKVVTLIHIMVDNLYQGQIVPSLGKWRANVNPGCDLPQNVVDRIVQRVEDANG